MNLKYAIAGLALLTGSAGVIALFNGRSGHEGDDSSNLVKSVEKSSSGRQTSVVSAHGAKRPDKFSGRKRRRGLPDEDRDDDGDDLPPEDRRLLSAIEEGRDDDSLEKVLKVLPEASVSTNAEIRSELVDALDSFGVPAMNHLLPFLADSDDDVRQSAIDSWTSSLGEVEDEKMKAGLITAVMQVLTDEDALETMATELTDMDEQLALQVLVDVIEGGKAPKQAVAAAREQYEFLTGDEYTTVEDADKWLAENYEPSSSGNAAKGN